MTSDLLLQLEQKVAHAVEVIELLRLHVEDLEHENALLKTEHEKWRKDLTALIKRFEQIEGPKNALFQSRPPVKSPSTVQEEEFMTV